MVSLRCRAGGRRMRHSPRLIDPSALAIRLRAAADLSARRCWDRRPLRALPNSMRATAPGESDTPLISSGPRAFRRNGAIAASSSASSWSRAAWWPTRWRFRKSARLVKALLHLADGSHGFALIASTRASLQATEASGRAWGRTVAERSRAPRRRRASTGALDGTEELASGRRVRRSGSPCGTRGDRKANSTSPCRPPRGPATRGANGRARCAGPGRRRS